MQLHIQQCRLEGRLVDHDGTAYDAVDREYPYPGRETWCRLPESLWRIVHPA